MPSQSDTGRVDFASRRIGAPPDAVYGAFAAARTLMAWLPPGGMTGCALGYDFQEGGRYRIALSYDEATPDVAGKTSQRADISRGRFLALIPGARIVQTVEFESDDPAFAGEMILTWTFRPDGEATLVVVEARHVPTGIAPKDHRAGLNASLANLARFLEPGGAETACSDRT